LIPLIHILPEDLLFTEASGIIKSISPSFNYTKNSILVEFEYNLDDTFALEVFLNSEDYPILVKLHSLYTSAEIDVSEDLNYLLATEKTVVKITLDWLEKLIYNTMNVDDFRAGSTFTLKIIQDKQEVSDRAKMTSFQILSGLISMTIDSKEVVYTSGTKETHYIPSLTSNNVACELLRIEGMFYIFQLTNSQVMVIAPHRAFDNHYLFLNNLFMRALKLEDNKLETRGKIFSFKDGNILQGFSITSIQKFFEVQYKEEYKQYIFNACRDNNLYSEISCLAPSIKHHSMTVYDLKTSVLFLGKTSFSRKWVKNENKYYIEILLEGISHRSQKRETRQFKLLIEPLRSLKIKSNSKNLGEFATFFRKEDENWIQEHLSDTTITLQSNGYITASNNNFVVSFKTSSLLFIRDYLRTNYSAYKTVSSRDFLLPMESIREVNFIDNSIRKTNGTFDKKQNIEDFIQRGFHQGESCFTDRDHFTDFAGLTFSLAPLVINMDSVNILNQDEIALLCRSVESVEYGLPRLKRDCHNFMYSMYLQYDFKEFFIILNVKQKIVYFINYSNKEVFKNEIQGALSGFITDFNYNQLKEFFIEGGWNSISYASKNLFTILSVDNSAFEQEVSVVWNYQGGIFEKMLLDNTKCSPTQTPENTLRTSFENKEDIFREFAKGMYASREVSVNQITLADSKLTIVMDVDGTQENLSIETKIGNFEFKKNLAKKINSTSEIYTSIEQINISSSQGIAHQYQWMQYAVCQTHLQISFAFDMNIIENIIENATLFTNETFSILHDSEGYVIHYTNGSKVEIGEKILIDDNELTLETEEEAWANLLDTSSEVKDIFTKISEFPEVTTENERLREAIVLTGEDCKIAKIPATLMQHKIIKE